MQEDLQAFEARIRALEAELESEHRRRLAVEAELEAARAEQEELRLAAQRAGLRFPAARMPQPPQGRTMVGLLIVAALVIFSLHGLLASQHNHRLRRRLRRVMASASAGQASSTVRSHDADPQLRAVYLAFSAGAFGRARSLALHLTARRPELARGWMLLGLSSCYRGVLVDARRAYRRLSRLPGGAERRLAIVCARHGLDVTK